jgi:hypothetical protein
MASSSAVSGGDLPVFVFPTELSFAPDLARNVLTVYNPYDFAVDYAGRRVLRTGQPFILS